MVGTGVALLATRRVDEWRRDEDTRKIVSDTDSEVPGAVLIGAGAASAGVSVWLFVRGEGTGTERRSKPSGIRLGITGSGLALQGTF